MVRFFEDYRIIIFPILFEIFRKAAFKIIPRRFIKNMQRTDKFQLEYIPAFRSL